MNLSEHFDLAEATYSETAIRLGLDNQPTPEILQNMVFAASKMEQVRSLLGFPVNVNSWLRLPDVNVAVGGSKISSHMDGWAIDLTCKSFGNPLAICKQIAQSGIKFDQMIHEFGSWTHISFAPAMRQQQLTIFRPQMKYVTGLYSSDEYAQLA